MWTIWLSTHDSTKQESYDPGEFSDTEAFWILQQMMITSVLMQGEEEEEGWGTEEQQLLSVQVSGSEESVILFPLILLNTQVTEFFLKKSGKKKHKRNIW